jgi:hypothetical protein
MYVILDQRHTNYRCFFDPPRLSDPLPPGTDRLAYELIRDPYQLNSILPKCGHDSLLSDPHEQLANQLEGIGDDFIRRFYA